MPEQQAAVQNPTLDRLMEHILQTVMDIRDASPRTPDDASSEEIADAIRDLIDEQCIVYGNAMAKTFAQSVLDAEYATFERNRKIDDTLGLSGPRAGITRSGQIIDLGDDSYVVEILNAVGKRGQTLWAVIANGQRVHRLFETKTLALLGYAEATNNGSGNPAVDYSNLMAAARVLRVPGA